MENLMENKKFKLESFILQKLNNILKTLKNNLMNQKIGIFVSGGIDSSIIATLTAKNFKNFYLISLETKFSKDKYYVELLGKFLNTKPHFVFAEKDNIIKIKPQIEKILLKEKIEPTKVHLPIAVSFYFLCQKAKELGIKHVFTGQGPDVLLAGYHKYKNIPLENLNKEITKDLKLLEIDKKRDQVIANLFEIKLYNPYLEREFIDLALKIPAEEKIKFVEGNRVEKWILRKAGEKLGIPKKIVWRPKKAIQYSTGVSKIVSKE